MLDKQLLEQAINQQLTQTDYFLVSLTVSLTNSIVIEIDSQQGVDLDFCVSLHRHIESVFDRDVEDYELEVGSAGLTSPFKVLRQYEKNIGNSVEVLASTGIKTKGTLIAVTPEYFTIEEQKMLRKEGDKRKMLYTETVTFAYGDVKATKLIF